MGFFVSLRLRLAVLAILNSEYCARTAARARAVVRVLTVARTQTVELVSRPCDEAVVSLPQPTTGPGTARLRVARLSEPCANSKARADYSTQLSAAAADRPLPGPLPREWG